MLNVTMYEEIYNGTNYLEKPSKEEKWMTEELSRKVKNYIL